MRHCFISSAQLTHNEIYLSKEQAQHLVSALRVKPGEILSIVCDEAELIDAKALKIDRNKIQIQELSRTPLPPPTLPQIELISCLPKQDAWTEVLDTCTQLGVDAFVPVFSSHSVIQLKQDELSKKMDRWKTIIENASCQSRRLRLPKLQEPKTMSELLKWHAESPVDLALLMNETETHISLKSVIQKNPILKSIRFILGPEGGFSSDEITQLIQAGFRSTSLGAAILKVPQAAFMTCTILNYEYRNLF